MNARVEKKAPLLPEFAIFNYYSFIAAIYCFAFSILYFAFVHSLFLSALHLLALLAVLINYFILDKTGNFKRAQSVILTTGTFVVTALYATGGWDKTGLLWPFAYLPFAFFLAGKKESLYWVWALMGGFAFVLVLQFTGIYSTPWSTATQVNFYAALIVLILCLNMFRKASLDYTSFMGLTRHLLETGSDPFFILDTEGKILDFNRAAEKLTGISRTAGNEPSFEMIFSQVQQAHDFLEKALTGTYLTNFPLTIQRSDGIRAEMLFNSSLYKDEATGKQRVLAIARDISEQKKAENYLRKFNEELETQVRKKTIELTNVFNRISDAFIAFNPDGEFTYVNRKAAELNHRSPEEMLGKNIWKEFPAETEGPFYAKFQEALNTQQNLHFEMYSPTLKRWIENYVYPSPDGISHFFRDITEKKAAEQALQRSEETRRLIVQSALDAIICIDMHGRITVWNPQAEKIFGWKEEEMIGQILSETIIPLRYRERHNVGLHNYLRTYEGPVLNKLIELTALHKNGIELPIELAIVPVKQDHEIFFCSFIRDITERKTAREEIANERNLLRNLVDHLPDYVYVKNREFRYQMTNRAMLSLVGASSEEETVGKNVLEIFGPEIAPANFAEDEAVIQSGNAMLNREESVKAGNGEQRWMLTSKVPLKDEHDRITGIIGISHDITERKRTEILLEELNTNLQNRAAELVTTNQQLEHFVYIASHDLQEPIRTIQGFIQLLRKQVQEVKDEKTEKYLEFIEKAGIRMRVLIKDLLDYSRIGKKKNQEWINLNSVLEEVREDLDGAIQEKKAQLLTGPMPQIFGYATEMKLLFQNLVSNAIKFSRKDVTPVIRIKANQTGDQWEFSVSDNGIGMEERYLEKIFVIFQRLHPRMEYEGSGIGLAHCKKIVELHNGTIRVESQPGTGSTFYVILPSTHET